MAYGWHFASAVKKEEVMKQSTKATYHQQVQGSLEQLRGLSQFVGREIKGFDDKWRDVWSRFEKVRREIEQPEADTIAISNELQTLKRSVLWLSKTSAGGEEVEEDMPLEELILSLPEGSVHRHIVGLITQAQQLVLRSFSMCLEANPMAGDVPAIRELQAVGARLSTMIQEVSKLRGLDRDQENLDAPR